MNSVTLPPNPYAFVQIREFRVSLKLRPDLPLPKGEGWGEGERDVLQPTSSNTLRACDGSWRQLCGQGIPRMLALKPDFN